MALFNVTASRMSQSSRINEFCALTLNHNNFIKDPPQDLFAILYSDSLHYGTL